MVSLSSLKDVPGLLERLDREDGTVPPRVLRIWMGKEESEFLNPEAEDSLWRVLSHPKSKINGLDLVRASPDLLLASNVLLHVKRWCQEIPAFSPRQLSLDLRGNYKESGQEFGELLRDALTFPNNRVAKLSIARITPVMICTSFLGPVLESPNNELLVLPIRYRSSMEASEAKSLSRGLASPNCKLKTLKLTECTMELDAALSVLDGLCASSCLEELEWTVNTAREDSLDVLIRLSRLLERPGNRFTSLNLRSLCVEQTHFSALAKGLASEYCQLQNLNLLNKRGRCENDMLPIVLVLRHPRNQLKELSLACHGPETAIALGESLKDPNCKLQSLTVNGDAANNLILIQAVANALQHPNVLQKLVLYHHGANFTPFVDSLKSQNNKLTHLRLCRALTSRPEIAARNVSLFCALRVSNVHKLLSDRMSDPFCRAFNARFFQVFHTLLSIKYVARLGQSSWLRILPVQDFILRIAATLGWPLDALRLPM